MQQIVKDNKTLSFYSEDQKIDLLYDIQKSSEAIVQWKAHIMRSVNQECAKQDIIAKLDQTSCLLVIDFAMKFLQLRYREKQSDWCGKRGLSWHISSVVSRSKSNTTEFYFRNNARKDFSGDTLCSQSHGGRTSNFCLIFSTPRLAKRMAALNLATVTSTPAATPPRPKPNALTADWTLGCRSETDSQSSRDDEAAESTSEIAMSAFTMPWRNLSR